MAANLSNIEQALERTIFHALRKKTVEFGYSPDINDYDIENTDIAIAESEQLRFLTDLKQIKETKGFAIEIFNYSNNQAYGDKKPARIVVETESFQIGQLGADTTPRYELQPDGTYSTVSSVSMLSDFYFNIHLIANSIDEIRVLHEIMVQSLPRRGYLPWYTDNGLRPHSNLLVRYISMADYSFLAEGIIEKVYRYEIPDAHEVDDAILQTNIPPITTITLDLGNNNEMIIN
jgi:hypothetical protein